MLSFLTGDRLAAIDSVPDLPAAPPRRRWLWSLFVANASPAALWIVAGLPAMAGAWLLLSPGRLMSREMTWDLLFIFSGAWHLQHGQVPHVDFHEPLASLNFLLPSLAFSWLGTTPAAFLASVAALGGIVFVLSYLAALRRLPLVPGAIFVLFAVFLVLMPTTVGDRLSAASFAMTYNRYGWSALAILTLILFLPPRSGRTGDWPDIAVAAVLILAMFYFKITYFVASLAALCLALLVCAHVRRAWKAWMALGLLLVANAVAPYNHPYLADLWHATLAGGIRPPRFALWTFLPGAMQHAPYVAALLFSVLVWRRGEAPFRLPAAMAFIWTIGLVLLSQNAEPDGVPLGIVMAFLLYDYLRFSPALARTDARLSGLLTVTVFPLFAVGASLVSLMLYSAGARNSEALTVVDRTQLRGLAVPAGDPLLLESFTRTPPGAQLLGQSRRVSGHVELTAYEYVQTLLEAADLLADGRKNGGIVVLDQVNPLPFMLGTRPPRGDNLWSGVERPVRPAKVVFADALYVLVPKFPTDAAWAARAYTEYGPYLAKHFPRRQETRSWIVFSRDSLEDGSKS